MPTTAAPTSAPAPTPTSSMAAQVRSATKVGHGDTEVHALRGVDLDVATGGFLAVMGPSGSGKSTLMHCLAGLDQLTSGEVRIGDVELGSLRERDLTRLRRDRIGFVFQAFNLIPTLTARENIELPSRLAGTRPDPAWVDAIVSTVGLGDRLGHRPAELSGGQQQRVAVARALATRPDLVFADEPTGNLDSRAGTEILRFLRTAADELGQTVVMVTHDPVAATHAHEAVILADGRIVDHVGSPTVDDVLARLAALGG
ncbi:MAG: ABC transporter ATP-binding protein [Acidimicrobiales bacterium]